MNYLRLEQQIMIDEGFRPRPYLDSVGVPTIGYGTTRILGAPVSMDGPPLTQEIGRQLLRQDLYGALVDAEALFRRFEELDSIRQEALANMAYNLGRRTLGRFGDLIEATEALDFDAMAEAAKASRWFHQVKSRGERIVRMLREGGE